jgi:hypothetical protein
MLAQLRERPEQELLVGYRLAHLQGGVPGGEHRQVIIVEVLDRLGVVLGELVVRDVVHPGAYDLGEQLPPGLPANRLGHYSNGFVGLYKAKRHDASQDRAGVRRNGRNAAIGADAS